MMFASIACNKTTWSVVSRSGLLGRLKRPSLILSPFSSASSFLPPVVTTISSREEVAAHIPCTYETIASKSPAFDNLQVSCAPKRSLEEFVLSRPEDSWIEISLPFARDVKLREKMLSIDNKTIKLSRLLEMLDSLAGDVAVRHTRAEKTSSGFTKSIVTASVSGLSSCSVIDVFRNICLRGHVSYVGNSAMEVTIEIIEDPRKPHEKRLSEIYFTMVALDPATSRPIPVPQMELQSDHEKHLFEMGKQRLMRKKIKAKESLTEKGPREDESQAIHQLYLDSVRLRAEVDNFNKSLSRSKKDISCPIPTKPVRNFKWSNHTINRSVILMHNQDTNVNGKIFGGYIMRLSFEAAWLCATLFYGTQDIKFTFLEDIQFVKPVHVGMVIEFVTRVAYSKKGHCVIHCNCYELDVETNVRSLTNVLHYVFATRDGKLRTEDCVEVIPRYYDEILSYLEGKRTLDDMLGPTK